MNPHRLEQAAADPAVRGAPLAVYVHLFYQLDPEVYKPQKLITIARALHMKEVTVGWALRRLVSAGYLAKGKGQGRTGTYRLVWTVTTAKAG